MRLGTTNGTRTFLLTTRASSDFLGVVIRYARVARVGRR